LAKPLTDQLHWHAVESSDAITALKSDSKRGLSDNEALHRLNVYGSNQILVEKRVSPFKTLTRQFANLLIAILLIAAFISAIFGEIIDALVILVMVLLAVSLGYLQQYRAERSLESLKKMLAPTCSVIRDTNLREISVEKIVPGDILILEAGDRVSADSRLLEAFNLEMNEAALTGEAAPVTKTIQAVDEKTGVSDRSNIVFAGTTVIQGRGKAIVIATGKCSELGKIAIEVTAIVQETTPLEQRMKEIGRKLGAISIILVAVIAAGTLLEEYYRSGSIELDSVTRIFLFAAALAVAAVPEALPAIVTGSLAIGMRIMARHGALIRRLPAVETLGCTQVICCDKTGTLTKGEMTVREVFLSDRSYEVTGAGYEPRGRIIPLQTTMEDPEGLKKFSKAALLSSDAFLLQEEGRWIVKGDTTEGALLAFAEKAGVKIDETRNANPRIGEFSFSSERKRLTTINETPEGSTIAYMKGAPEVVLSLCSQVREKDDARELVHDDKTRIQKISTQMAEKSFRVLAIAEKQLSSIPSPLVEKDIESDFTFLGLAGILDPPRQDAIHAVATAKTVGIKPIMITGDHLQTALAVAKATGIFGNEDMILTGSQLDKLTDEALEENIEAVTVYARVSPNHKLRLVDAWKKTGEIIAMTGDGVNDAPALKKADIGIAMGITGTDVAKEAADLILADDNFATIVTAIELGRWIYDNIKKYLAYLLQANFVEIAVMTIASLLILPVIGLYGEQTLPLLATQILYVNLATDGLPAIALGFSPPDSDLLKRPPRQKNESVFTSDVTSLIIMALLIQTPVLLLGFFTSLPEGIAVARSRMFLMLIVIELVMALNCRSLTHTIFEAKPHKWLMISVAFEILLISIIILIPVTRIALGIVYPTANDLLWVVASALETMLSIEFLKRYRKKFFMSGLT